MENYLYLYTSPFVVKDTTSNRYQYIFDHFDDDTRRDEKRLHDLVLKFVVDEGIGETISGQLFHNKEEDTGSWIWMMNWMSFRSLVDMKQYANLMSALRSNNGRALEKILDLHTRLGSLMDARILNTIAHRTMSSISLIPYPVPSDSKEIAWELIHRETPFIWLVIFIGTIFHSEARPIPVKVM